MLTQSSYDNPMQAKPFLSTSEVAKLLGISRIAVFKRIRKGDIRAIKVGRTYVIKSADLSNIFGATLTNQDKQVVDQVVKKAVSEYGETLRLLGGE